MYSIYADGKTIFLPGDDVYTVTDPSLTLEVGKAGSLEFNIYPGHPMYNDLNRLKTIVTVNSGSTEIFRGRVLSVDRDFNNVKAVYCEGLLAYLVDSVQKNEAFEGTSTEFLSHVIAGHNERMPAEKQFIMGNVTVESRNIIVSGQSDRIQDLETEEFDYRQIVINCTTVDWKTTFDYIQSNLIDYCGGYLKARYSGGQLYLDYLSSYGGTATQKIEFGKNMLDFMEETNTEDLYTILIPLGDDNLTVADANGGSDEIADSAAVAKYGKIYRTHGFSGVRDAATLLENAQRYLQNEPPTPTSITVTALDLHLVDPSISEIFVGDIVNVKSAPHGISANYTCTQIEYDLVSPDNTTYTFGIPRPTLTQRYRQDKSIDSGGGGGGGEAAEEQNEKELTKAYDAWVNWDDATGHVSIGGMYQEFKNSITILKNECGIDFEGSTGNVNLQSISQKVDENKQIIYQNSARMDILQTNLETQLALTAGRIATIDSEQKEHYASLALKVDNNEARITSKADALELTAFNTALNTLGEDVANLKNILIDQVGVVLDSSRNNVNIYSMATRVNSLGVRVTAAEADVDLLTDANSATASLLASYQAEIGERLAQITATANEQGSALLLKADKITIDGELELLNGKYNSLSSDIARVEALIATRINAALASISSLSVGTLEAVTVKSKNISANGIIVQNGKPVATQEWVNAQNSGYATQEWVNEQGYVSSIGNDIASKTWVTDQRYLTYISPNGVESEGRITFTYAKAGGGTGTFSFNIAATQKYLDGVAAARSTGWTTAVGKVSYPNAPGEGQSFSCTFPAAAYNEVTTRSFSLGISDELSGKYVAVSSGGNNVAKYSIESEISSARSSGRSTGWTTAVGKVSYPNAPGEGQSFSCTFPAAAYNEVTTRSFEIGTATELSGTYAVVNSGGNSVAKYNLSSVIDDARRYGWSVAYGKVSFPTSTQTGQSFNCQFPNGNYNGQTTESYILSKTTVDSSYYVDAKRNGSTTVARINVDSVYDDGKTDGWAGCRNSMSATYSGNTGTIRGKKTPGASVTTLFTVYANPSTGALTITKIN